MATRLKIATGLSILSLVVVAPAYAQDSSLEGYGGPGGNIQDQLDQGGPAPAPTDDGAVRDDADGGGRGPAGDEGGRSPGEGGRAGEEAAGEPRRASERPRATSGGKLPFTGLDLGLVAAAGAGLLAAGIGMRRLTHAPDAA